MSATWIIPARLFITQNEGCRLTAYRDSCGVPTIGAGLIRLNGKPVTIGMTITQAQADAGLAFELIQTEKLLTALVTVALADNEAVALADFAYNLGGGALSSSTLLRMLNAGNRAGAAAQFPAWDKGHVNGRLVEIPGLRTRRLREQAMFLTGAMPAPIASLNIAASAAQPARQPAPATGEPSADDLMQQEIDQLGDDAA